jgi:hypothetical protein
MCDLELFLFDRAYGTLTCTSTTANALIRIDFELAISHADCANRALSFASTTSYAAVTNFECHFSLPPYLLMPQADARLLLV